jgi:hypothetical protein
MLDLAGVRCFHWGDIDAGGFRVLRGLRKVGAVTALYMDAETLKAHAREPLDESKRNAITHELEYWQSGVEREVLESCLQLDGWLEQETIDPVAVLNEVAKGGQPTCAPYKRSKDQSPNIHGSQ